MNVNGDFGYKGRQHIAFSEKDCSLIVSLSSSYKERIIGEGNTQQHFHFYGAVDLKKLLYALSMLRNQKTFGFVNGKGEFIKFIFEEDDTHCHSFISKANTPRCELRDADFEDLELIIQDLLLPLESEFSVVSIQST